MKPRVLWIHQNFVTARDAGNSRGMHLVAALRARGWSVDLICSQETYFGLPAVRSGSNEVIVEIDGDLSLHRLPKVTRGTYLKRSFRAYYEFNAQALRHARRLPRPDVVYATSPPSPQLLPSLWIAATQRVPVIFEVRDLWPAFLVDGGLLPRGVASEALSWLEVLGCRAAPACVTTSPAFVPYLERLGAADVRVAPTGADSSVLRADAAEGRAWRRRLQLEGRIVVAYTGSLNEAYGVPLLLRAAQQSASLEPRIVWVFAGGGRDAQAVESAAAQHECIRWLGSVPKQELIPVLVGADIAVEAHAAWPLLETTVSGKLFDYMAAALPVVSVSRGLTAEFLNAAGSGVTAEPSAETLAEKVVALARLDATTRRDMGLAGRRWVARHVPADRSAQDILATIEEARSAPALTVRRLLAHAVAAGVSVASRKPGRALLAAYGGHRPTTVHSAFDAWLASVDRRSDE